MRWHRDIVRRRWAARSAHGRTGRPATRRNIKALIRLLARENPEWGYRRIHGELAGLGVNIAASTVWEILKASGINPARRRTGPTWPQFLRSQAEAILACDFFTAGLLNGTQAYVLAVIEHGTRRVRIFGVTLHPTGQWTAQQARNLLMDLGEQADRVKFMIRDRGPNFTAAFDAVLADAGIRAVLCTIRTPRMNAIAERWIGGCRRELLDRTLIWNQAHLRRILHDHETHHNQHRPHRSLDGVRAENRIHCSDQQVCPPGAPPVMITDHVYSVRLPPDHTARLMAAAVPARGGVEDRRDPDLAPPSSPSCSGGRRATRN